MQITIISYVVELANVLEYYRNNFIDKLLMNKNLDISDTSNITSYKNYIFNIL
jgi:hypothetical protein